MRRGNLTLPQAKKVADLPKDERPAAIEKIKNKEKEEGGATSGATARLPDGTYPLLLGPIWLFTNNRKRGGSYDPCRAYFASH
jgi:hypothetical protein